LDAVRRRVLSEPQATIARGVDFLLYLMADAVVDRNFPILDSFNDELEDLESAVFENTQPEQLQRIFEMKRALVTLRRVLSPQRDVLSFLAKRGIPNVGERTALYFRDVYDHLVRLYEQIDAGRDLLGNVMDGYLSMVANRTNDITKQLTIFATIFLPLSFITGFFGQNFDLLTHRGFFWLMLVSVIGLPVGLMFWFKSKRWI
jgi:magnesium transporter